MRQTRVLAPPRRVPVRLPAPVLVAPPRPPAPPPWPPAPVVRRAAPAPDLRPPAIILTLRRPAIVLALRDTVIALVPRWPALIPRWPTASLADMARPIAARTDAEQSGFAAALRRPGLALSAALAHAVFGLKLAAAALVAGVVGLAVMNNLQDNRQDNRQVRPAATGGYELASLPNNETVIVRRPSFSHADDADADTVADRPEQPVSYYQRAIQTIRFLNPIPRIALAAAVPDAPGLVKVHGFTVFAPRDTDSEASRSVVRRRPPSGSPMDEIDDYLWEVYQRQPIKRDSTGDFSWKDPAAAKRMGLSLEDYVIGGMDAKFREQLYRAGRAMDAEGIQWSMLSAFRDDYRQRLAEGFKARTGNSLHGGSRRTGGYGHGRAIDITSAEGWGDADAVWKWLDVHGSKYGLHRPMPGNDPAHVQQLGESPRKASGGGREGRSKFAGTKKRKKIRVARAK
jgi:hypothetical protein